MAAVPLWRSDVELVTADTIATRRRATLVSLGFFLLLSLAWTWPLVTRLTWRIPHDPGDPVLNTWILWWSTQAVPFTDAWWSPPIFHPMRGALALSEHLAGIAVFTVPLHAAGLPPVAAYNIALILTGWLSGYFAFLLGRRLTGSTVAGLVAGVAFALAPYRASQLSHLQVLTSQWMPLALFGMHSYLEEGRGRWLVLFAGAWLLQATSNGYYLLFFPVLIGLWLAWFVHWRTNWRRGLAIAGAFAGSSALLLPALLHYKAVHDGLGLRRTVDEILGFSAQLTSFVQPAHLLTFWPTLRAETQEGFLFPGVTVIGLCLAGALALGARARIRHAIVCRSPGVFYGVTALLLWWLCFGPAQEDSAAAVLRRPYSLLLWLPGFDGLRVPARFAMLATLCVSTAAALATARLMPRTRWRRAIFATVIFTGLFVDGWIDDLPLTASPQRVMISAPAAAPVIELPVDQAAVSLAAMYRSIEHRRPVVNGYSGHTPAHYDLLSRALRAGDPTILTHYARGTGLIVVVHRTFDEDRKWSRFVEGAGGVRQLETGVGPVFFIAPQAHQRQPPLGSVLEAVNVPSPPGSVTIDLGSEVVVRALRLPLRGRHRDIVPTLLVEISNDGENWTEAWQGWTGEAALIAALEDQRIEPMEIYLPDVRTRYIRVTPGRRWIARGLTAIGPR